MKLRKLEANEYHLVKHVFDLFNAELPIPDQMYLFVVEEKGEIISLCGFEQIPHLGCLWTREDYLSQGLMTRLIKFVENKLNKTPRGGFYMFPSTPAAVRVTQKAGLVNTGLEVWKKEF